MLRLALIAACLSLGAPALAQVYVYPLNNQSEAQQRSDEAECQHWAVNQTGYHPNQQSQVGRSAGRGAVRGGIGGAVIGGIAGDAGKGAAAGAVIGGVGSGVRQSAAEDRARQNWTRAYAACLDARGYSVR